MWVRWVSNRCALTKSLNALLPQPAYARDLVYVSPAKPRVTDGARTRGLRDTIRNSTLCSVLTCPSWSENSAYLSLICNFALIAFSVLFGSFLNLLLPHCCRSPSKSTPSKAPPIQQATHSWVRKPGRKTTVRSCNPGLMLQSKHGRSLGSRANRWVANVTTGH